MTVSVGLSLPYFDLCCCQLASSVTILQHSQANAKLIHYKRGVLSLYGIRHKLNHTVYYSTACCEKQQVLMWCKNQNGEMLMLSQVEF